MPTRAALVLLSGPLVLGGCSRDLLPTVNVISVSRIGDVLGEVRRQVSLYEWQVNYWHEQPDEDPAKIAAAARGPYRCGNGRIDFDVRSVKLDLTTTLDKTLSGSAGITASPGSPVASVGGTGSLGHQVRNTQELEFTMWPLADRTYRRGDTPTPGVEPEPIADALLNLRASLLASATVPGVCVYDYDYRKPDAEAGNKYTLGLEVTDSKEAGVDLKLTLLDLGVKYLSNTATGNTLTVAFVQRDIPDRAIAIGADGLPLPLRAVQPGRPHRGPTVAGGDPNPGAAERIPGHFGAVTAPWDPRTGEAGLLRVSPTEKRLFVPSPVPPVTSPGAPGE